MKRKTKFSAAFLALALMGTGVVFLSATFRAADAYIRYDLNAGKADPGYPKKIKAKAWPGVRKKGIDAAINWGNGKAYFAPLK